MTAVLLLHGWPGGTSDFRRVLPLLHGLDVHVPALHGFGDAFLGEVAAGEQSAERHAERLRELIATSGLERPVLAGYDVGSRVGQAFARRWPDEISALVCTPGYPGVQEHIGSEQARKEYWYQHFNRLELARRLLDGDPSQIATYLKHFWSHWAAADDLADGPEFDALVAQYARPGAYWASTAWYRDNPTLQADAPVRVPTTMLWPKADPLYLPEWADQLERWFTEVDLRLVEGGHFVPLEAPDAFAAAVREAAG